MWNYKNVSSFVKNMAKANPSVTNTQIMDMFTDEYDTECKRYKDAGYRVTAKRRDEIVEVVLSRVNYWIGLDDVETIGPYEIATYRPQALFFRLLKR